jgi:hypothetical protein
VVAAARSAQFVEPFLPLLLLVALDAGPTTVAAVLLGQQSAAVAGFVALGLVSSRWRVLALLRLGLVGSAAGCAALAVAPGVWVAALGAVAFGFSAALWRGAAQAMLPLSLTEGAGTEAGVRGSDAGATRSRAFGLVVVASNAGALLSAAAGAAGLPIRAMFVIQAVALGAGLLLTVRVPPPRVVRPPSTLLPVGGGKPARRAMVRFWLMALAIAPATAVMFQAFSGLALALTPTQYRTMVVVNAATLVLGQPVISWVTRRVSAAAALAGATAVMGAGMAVQIRLPDAVVVTVVWTLAELVVIVVPAAVVSGLAPHARQGAFVGRFQAVQGIVAAAATYLGPMVASRSTSGFAIGCIAVGTLGLLAVAAVRHRVGTAMRQPVDCPCGALLCVCDDAHQSCANPTPVLVHGGTSAGSPSHAGHHDSSGPSTR